MEAFLIIYFTLAAFTGAYAFVDMLRAQAENPFHNFAASAFWGIVAAIIWPWAWFWHFKNS